MCLHRVSVSVARLAVCCPFAPVGHCMKLNSGGEKLICWSEGQKFKNHNTQRSGAGHPEYSDIRLASVRRRLVGILVCPLKRHKRVCVSVCVLADSHEKQDGGGAHSRLGSMTDGQTEEAAALIVGLTDRLGGKPE
ncbi:hypothetical protein ILYODFUR_005744 [Ilyodon furcidens]|uniref:Uncharacterized protein n=1 Tax=Ilyodon furcidens TaxID=33524 RepID=A0ABV0THF7_9TELE